MLKARVGIRTMMIVVVLAAMLLGALRLILLMLDVFGSDFLYFVVSAFTLYVFLPTLVIVESIFALGYFWLRRKRALQTLKPATIATPEPHGSGEKVAAMSAVPVSRPWRRFLRFSVRGMIVVVLLVGGCLGWIVRSARIQREAVAAITKSGGSVNYNWEEWKNGVLVPGGRPWAPRWLVDLLGVDYFGHVTCVSYWQGELDRSAARTAEVVARASELQAVINDALGGTNREPESLTQEEQQKILKLAMSDGKTFGAKLEELNQLWHRDDFRCTDEELAHLKWLTDLSELDLHSTSVSDAGLAHIERLIKLERLELRGTPVTDAGLARLKGLVNLGFLNLSFTPVTDAGLVHLKALTKLTSLNLQGTSVTDAGVRKLQQALPSLNIYR